MIYFFNKAISAGVYSVGRDRRCFELVLNRSFSYGQTSAVCFEIVRKPGATSNRYVKRNRPRIKWQNGGCRRSGNNGRNCQHYKKSGAVSVRMFGDNTLAYRYSYRVAVFQSKFLQKEISFARVLLLIFLHTFTRCKTIWRFVFRYSSLTIISWIASWILSLRTNINYDI